MPMISFLLRSIVLGVVLCGSAQSDFASIAQSATQSAVSSRITTASGVRLRAEPGPTATEIARLPVGMVMQQLERSATREKVGENQDYWYRVSTSDGRSGWIFGALSLAIDPANPDVVYRRIATDRLKLEDDKTSFAEQADLFKFLTRAITEVRNTEVLAELEFARLRALQRAMRLVPMEKLEQQPYSGLIKENAKLLVFGEPGAVWLIRQEAFLELHKKYRTLPLADEIVWEAVENGLPGECEMYLPCQFESSLMLEARYLDLYPQGRHTTEALRRLEEFLSGVARHASNKDIYDVPREDRPALQKSIARMRTVIARLNAAKRVTLTAYLDRIAKAFP